MNIEEIIKPENGLEELLISNKEWIEGATYPLPPRSGHPEGAVINHIKEVLANVDIYGSPSNRDNLRLITLIHDTFKYKVDDKLPKSGENNHGMIARRFAERFGISNPIILDIIELHDSAYNAWCNGSRDGKWPKAEARAKRLVERLDNLDVNALELYLEFYRCDNNTTSKQQDSVIWFEDLIV